MHDVTLIVDQYQRYKESHQRGQRLDPAYEAQGLSQLIKPFGRHERRIAIVSQDDREGLEAYQNAGFETIAMNGNRPREINRFITQINRQLDTTPPQHMILMTTDPTFTLLCDHAVWTKRTNLAVWAPAGDVAPELTDPEYGYRPLEELLPSIRVPRVDIRLDFENLYLGLVQRGWTAGPQALVEAVRAEAASLGQITNFLAYGDWGLLSKDSNLDLQRELALLGVETRYQVNMRGKNSADMKIADDIRTLMERDESSPDAADIILLGTCDRDFRPLIETARQRGKRLVVLGLENGISRLLQSSAGEVRYVDQRLTLAAAPARPAGQLEALALRALVLRARRGWKWFQPARLVEELALDEREQALLARAVEEGVFKRGTRFIKTAGETQEQAETLELNWEHQTVKAAALMQRWIPARVGYLLGEKGMPYVDTAFLARGMSLDHTLKAQGVGQTRPDVETWLKAAARAGLVVKKTIPHPKVPERKIDTWDLPPAPAPAQDSPAQPALEAVEPSEPPAPVTPPPAPAARPEPAPRPTPLTPPVAVQSIAV